MATNNNDMGGDADAGDSGPTLAQAVAERCKAAAQLDDGPLFSWLVERRRVAKKVVQRALDKGSLGLSNWRHADKTMGTVGYGGPAAAFIVRDPTTLQVHAVDMRYFDPDTNGGQKVCVKGEQRGHAWCSDWTRLQEAKTVYVVDSPLNALSVESCLLPYSAVVATRGTANVEHIDWTFLRHKFVVACFGNDPASSKPGPDFGYSPGLRAAWRLHEILIGLDVSCMLVDQGSWFEDADHKRPIRDPNDWLLSAEPEKGWEKLTIALRKLEEWAIPGMPAEGRREGRARLFLPSHDWFAYTRYRVEPDFTRTVDKQIKDEETGITRWTYNDTCGFRVVAVSRVTIASPTSTMTGDKDQSPTVVFSLSVQTARHGPDLVRRVVDDEKLHNIDGWKKIGPVYSVPAFSRLLNVLERGASIGARKAVNFVGLCWLDGKPVVNEGPASFFADPKQQCPYHALTFPSGSPVDGAAVIRAYQKTFKDNAAAIPLVWGLGGHLKAFLGFWPHFQLQAEKGTGKSTLIKRLERSLSFTMFSRQSMATEFRMLTTLSYTSHPVGWEEISAGKQEMINKAVAQLQEAYQYSHTRRGADMIDFLLCAPVLLAGEDVPVEGLTGKLVRCQLTKAKRGPLLDDKLPVFPVRQWLQFLASLGKEEVLELHARMVEDFSQNCVAAADAGAERMVVNYAALATAWMLLCDFTGVPEGSWNFTFDLVAEMNAHITETVSDRQPWALIIDKLLSEIAAKQFRHPFKFDHEDGVPVLCVRTKHVMDHMSQANHLRAFWDGITLKSDRVLKQQLTSAGVLLMDQIEPDKVTHVEKTVSGQRVPHMVAMSLRELERFGLHATIPKDEDLP